MSGETPEDLARRGRLIAFNEYALNLDQLAIVAFLSAAHEDNGSAASAFAERVWSDLIATNPELAEQVWQAAKSEQVSNARTLVAIASSLSQHNKETR